MSAKLIFGSYGFDGPSGFVWPQGFDIGGTSGSLVLIHTLVVVSEGAFCYE